MLANARRRLIPRVHGNEHSLTKCIVLGMCDKRLIFSFSQHIVFIAIQRLWRRAKLICLARYGVRTSSAHSGDWQCSLGRPRPEGAPGDRAEYPRMRWTLRPDSSQIPRGEDLFLDPGPLVDGDLTLHLARTEPGDVLRGLAPQYVFQMRKTGTPVVMGQISLRLGESVSLTHYVGHIGYSVAEPFRGHRYAARACRLLFDLARRHGMRELWITCNPENLASRRTCELAGGELVEIVDVPRHYEMYRRGETRKCRYRVVLQNGEKPQSDTASGEAELPAADAQR